MNFTPIRSECREGHDVAFFTVGAGVAGDVGDGLAGVGVPGECLEGDLGCVVGDQWPSRDSRKTGTAVYPYFFSTVM